MRSKIWFYAFLVLAAGLGFALNHIHRQLDREYSNMFEVAMLEDRLARTSVLAIQLYIINMDLAEQIKRDLKLRKDI